MKKVKTISVFQTDNSQNVNVLLRGLSVLSLKKSKNNVILDMRPDSDIVWSYYGKNNVKYLDDILNIILDINVSMLKTYLNSNSDILCVKDIKKVLSNDNFLFIIKSLSEIYDSIYISFIDNSFVTDFLFLSDAVLFPVTNDPVSLSIYKNTVSKLLINKRKNINFIPIIFKTDTDFNVDDKKYGMFLKNSVTLNFSLQTLIRTQSTKFMFNDTANDFVAGIVDILNVISTEQSCENEKNGNYGVRN